MEAAAGFGLMTGPPIGSIAYSQLGYSWAFWIFAVLFGYNLIILLVYMPQKLNGDGVADRILSSAIMEDLPEKPDDSGRG